MRKRVNAKNVLLQLGYVVVQTVDASYTTTTIMDKPRPDTAPHTGVVHAKVRQILLNCIESQKGNPAMASALVALGAGWTPEEAARYQVEFYSIAPRPCC